MQNLALNCPACSRPVKLSFTIADVEKTEWVFCGCGSVFHHQKIEKKYFNDEYLQKFADYKGIEERFDYLMRVYLPLVEECTYGRRFLDVGYGLTQNLVTLGQRGWITSGVDLAADGKDFEKENFGNKKYDFILMSSVVESFHDPLKALFKARELLMPQGLMLVVGADAELIYQLGMFEFGNWNSKEKWLIFGETQMKKTLESMGLRIVLSRKNLEKRFVGWNQYHILVQKIGDK